jgi:diguanylate cyclase (GGDEF)-like protein
LIADYLENCGYTSSIETATITQTISDKAKSIFPLFEIEIDETEHIRIIETAKNELTALSDNLILQVEQQSRDLKQLQGEAATDGLTKLYNKSNFIETLNREIKRSIRYGNPLSIIMADIDYFKSINDFYGHLAGDHTLKFIATKLKEELRDSDYIARYGGEEFVVISPSTPQSGAYLVAERLRKTIHSTRVNYRGKEISLTMSFGVASLDDRQPPGVEGFIQMADEALYTAKRAGRNRTCVYEHAKLDNTYPVVLVVDDEEVVLITVSKMLERLGYGAILARNGREALDLFDQHKKNIDTVFLDVKMPGLSPIEVLTNIKNRSTNVRVLLSSGYSNDQIEENLVNNCDGFLAKPYTPSELSEKLQGKVVRLRAAK